MCYEERSNNPHFVGCPIQPWTVFKAGENE